MLSVAVFRVSAMEIKSHLDLTQIFCDVDDFYQNFERWCHSTPQLTACVGEKLCRSRLSLSEVMTIVIGFHGSGYRTFKDFYTLQVNVSSLSSLASKPYILRFLEFMSPPQV